MKDRECERVRKKDQRRDSKINIPFSNITAALSYLYNIDLSFIDI